MTLMSPTRRASFCAERKSQIREEEDKNKKTGKIHTKELCHFELDCFNFYIGDLGR